jgi:phosphoribosylformimino-5-aminoimidazole carboxamide ribotide isomerase
VGGGIRTKQDVEQLLSIGIDRLVIGTAIARRPGDVSEWVGEFGPLFYGAVDALDGWVKIKGWETDSGIEDRELIRRIGSLGLGGIIYTSIARDGTLEGPDIERTNTIAAESGLAVVISGGISGPDDIEKVARQSHPGVEGVIVGKALYEKRLSLGSVISRFQRT